MSGEFHPIELIHSFQSKYDVTHLKAGALNIWPIVLFELSNCARATTVNDKTSLVKSAINELLSFFKRHIQQIRDHKNTAPESLTEDIIFLTQSTRRVRLNGKYYDRICDPFVDAFKENGYNCLILEWSYDHQYKVPRYNPSEFIQDHIDIAIASALVSGKTRSFVVELLNTQEFRRILGYWSIDPNMFINRIRRSVNLILAIKNYFNRRLKVSGVKYAFYYPYYGTISFAFNLACKMNRIRVIEIQHGYFGGYTNMQNGYRNLTCKYDLLPDAVWCWRNSDKETILKWGQNGSLLPRCFVGGNLWNNIWKYPGANQNEFNSDVNLKANTINKSNVRVLLTLSPYFDMPAWLPDAIKNTSSPSVWFIRFHHNTDKNIRELYMKVFADIAHAEYETANSLPLPTLIRMSDIHVTINSSCTAEAMEFGIKTIITGEIGIRVAQYYVENRWAFPALSSEQFHSAFLELTTEKFENKQPEPNDKILSNAELVRRFITFIENQ
jgi:hypothetical protein